MSPERQWIHRQAEAAERRPMWDAHMEDDDPIRGIAVALWITGLLALLWIVC